MGCLESLAAALLLHPREEASPVMLLVASSIQGLGDFLKDLRGFFSLRGKKK